MATASPTPKKKKEHRIPVRVVASPRRVSPPASTVAAPRVPKKVEPPAAEPVRLEPPTVVKPKEKISVPPPVMRAPMSEEQRRRTMWWTVGIGITIILIVWLATVRYEISSSGQKSNIISDIVHSFRNLNFGAPAQKPSPKQEEIKKYEQQVFPQFSNTNS